ncbi:MAG: selenocysteine-specific translation elongation factor [Phycisphaerales bacterium]|nr:MAG: selenocysteine-specific translation elongation factor [Phycisphaerales bacterium]
MDPAQKNITLGTAGHIDHGKTALIKCLTGCDTDYLKAEKERGMSIDLGFAPCTLADTEVGIVDVPGHENFIKTMVAGASGIDATIFVIAADDGVMPQTQEHLDILWLLGVKQGIVALTKVDRVGPERLGTVTAEVRDFLQGTFLDGAPILPVSSITGQGFDAFYEALMKLVTSVTPKTTDGVFRLPVERTFSVKGYGTVVTGIPVSGSAKIGDEVVLFPHQTKGRIRAIQVYKHDGDTALVGQCAALSVPQWDYKSIERGNVVTVGEYFTPQRWYLCDLHVLSHEGIGVKHGTTMRFHTGTSQVVATIYLMQGNTASAGQRHLVQVKLEEPVVAAPGDRFILRTLSPAHTVGGGMIVEAIPKRLKRSNPEVLEDGQIRAKAVANRNDFVEYCIRTAKSFATSEGELSRRTKVPPEPLKQILSGLIDQGTVLELGSKAYNHKDTAELIRKKLLATVSDFHKRQPESPGIPTEQLLVSAQLAKGVFDGILRLLLAEGKLVERKHCLALAEHSETFDEPELQLLRKVESLFKARPFKPPSYREVAEQTQAAPEQVQRILRILSEQERLVRVENDLLFHADAVEKARQTLTSFIKKEGRLESVKFKYLLDTTRKFAIPLLDYFDRIGVTRRLGNTRYLNAPTRT